MLHGGCRSGVAAELGGNRAVAARGDKCLVMGTAEGIAGGVGEGNCCWGRDGNCIGFLSTERGS